MALRLSGVYMLDKAETLFTESLNPADAFVKRMIANNDVTKITRFIKIPCVKMVTLAGHYLVNVLCGH